MMGVYILIKDWEPIYVGRTRNFEVRMKTHKVKDFDYYVFIPTKDFRLNWMESILISILQPKLNKVQNWFVFQDRDENIDYLKNFRTKRKKTLCLYPGGSHRYYFNNPK